MGPALTTEGELRESKSDKYVGKLRHVASVTEKRKRFKPGMEEGEGQDTIGAERPAGMRRRSNDLNRPELAQAHLGAPQASRRCSRFSSLLRASGAMERQSSLSQYVSEQLPPLPPSPAGQATLDPGAQRSGPWPQRIAPALTSDQLPAQEPGHALPVLRKGGTAPTL